MRARIAAAIVALLIVASLIFVGVICAAFAIDTALTGLMGTAGAAALTALLLLAGPCIWALFAALREPPKKHNEELIGTIVSAVLRSSSLYAILGAGLLGLAETFLNRRKKK